MMRVGIGYDVHQFAADRPLILGGIKLADRGGLLGHSDADVVLHAVADAMLGAAALGDIGHHFPPSDPRLAGLDSRAIIVEARSLVAEAGYIVGNVDITVIAEAPRLAPHIHAMRTTLAEMLDVEIDRVSLKATTNEGMGFVGRKEGIAALAVAALAPISTAE